MIPSIGHPEARRLMRDAAWVAALVALIWSPLPEIVLGHWLQICNDSRPETGRAHDRLDLLQESDSQAVTRSTIIEKEKEESSRVATLGQMRQFLLRQSELDMSLAGFREFFGSMSAWQREQVLSADDLSLLAQRGLSSVQVSRHGAHARFTFLDESRNRLAGAEVDLFQLQLLPLGLSNVAVQDTAVMLADIQSLESSPGRTTPELSPPHRELLGRLRQLPGVSLQRVWHADGQILLIEISVEGRRSWLRPASTGAENVDKNGRGGRP